MRTLLVSLLALTSNAWSQPIPIGEQVNASASICSTRAEAEAVVKTHQSQGFQKAQELFARTCTSAMVAITPIQVVGRYQVDTGVMKVIKVLVVMKDDSQKEFYILTTNPIKDEV
jgi:hypothetical protein